MSATNWVKEHKQTPGLDQTTGKPSGFSPNRLRPAAAPTKAPAVPQHRRRGAPKAAGVNSITWCGGGAVHPSTCRRRSHADGRDERSRGSAAGWSDCWRDGSDVRFRTQRARLQICELQTSVDTETCYFSAQQEPRVAKPGEMLPNGCQSQVASADPCRIRILRTADPLRPQPNPAGSGKAAIRCVCLRRTAPKILLNRRNLMAN